MTTFIIYGISPIIITLFVNVIHRKSGTSSFKKKNKKIIVVLCGIVIALMIGMRSYSIGSSDSALYYYRWGLFSEQPLSDCFQVIKNQSFEFGYTFVTFIISHIFPNPQFLFIFSGIFISISVCRFIYKYCNDVCLAFLAFNSLELFVFMVQGLRQALAMCICLYAIDCCKKRDFIKFILFVILAMSFHAASIVFIIAYFFKSFNLSFSHLCLFTVISLISVWSIEYLFVFVNFFIREKYTFGVSAQDGSGIITILIYVSILVFSLIWKRKNTNCYSDYSFFFYMTLVALEILLMRNSVAMIAERISYFFAFGEIVLVSNSISNIENNMIRVFSKIIVCILFILLLIHKATYTSLVPYLFFWQ